MTFFIQKDGEEVEVGAAVYLRDLSDRLMAVPTQYGTDQGDCDQLKEIARQIEAGTGF